MPSAFTNKVTAPEENNPLRRSFHFSLDFLRISKQISHILNTIQNTNEEQTMFIRIRHMMIGKNMRSLTSALTVLRYLSQISEYRCVSSLFRSNKTRVTSTKSIKNDYSALRQASIRRKENIVSRQGKHQSA